MELGSITSILAGLIGFLALTGIGFVLVGGEASSAKASKRLGALSVDKRTPQSKARNTVDNQARRRKQIVKALKTQEQLERRASLSLEARIVRAGLNITPTVFWVASGIASLISILPAILFRAPIFVIIGVPIAAGLGLPRMVLNTMAEGRLKKFTKMFPDAIDAIVRGVKTGLPVHDCLKLIAAEAEDPLGIEFKKLLDNISIGLGMQESLDKLYSRVPSSEVRFFSIVLAIQQSTGGNLAEALNNLSVVIRSRMMLREKIKALSSEAVASAFIIGSLPPGIMVLISLMQPGFMAPLFHDPRGPLYLASAAGIEAIGIFVMRRMINLKL